VHSSLLVFFGVSALMHFSMGELARSIQFVAGSKFRSWLSLFTENRVTACALGILMSMLLGSSGAVTVMLVGLANARLLSLEQVFAVTLGAGVGTTFIVQLIALRISDYGLLLIAGGLVVESTTKTMRVQRIGRIVFFLGLLFYCLELLVSAGQGLYQELWFRRALSFLYDRPIVTLWISTILTAVLHSSASTITFVMSLAVVQEADIFWALPWILGANLGSTANAYFASLKSGLLGRQAAMGNLLIKVAGVALCFPLLGLISEAFDLFSSSITYKIAMAHTLFNVLVAVIFLPMISVGVRWTRRLCPGVDKEEGFQLLFIDQSNIGPSEMALAQAQKEIHRLSSIVTPLIDCSIELFDAPKPELAERLTEKDKLVDYLNKNIRRYLTRLSQSEMTPEQSQREFELLIRTNDLENIADIVEKNILPLARKTWNKGYRFSPAGWAELKRFHLEVTECVRSSVEIFDNREFSGRADLTRKYESLESMMLELSERHIHRLHQKVRESLDTSSVHLDLLGHYQRIAALSVNFLRLRDIRTEANGAASPTAAPGGK
jgi:phosphate:Na+ symporter